MAKILVLGAKVPFTRGGQEALVDSLVRELRKRDHLVDTVEIPYAPVPKEGLLNQAALWRSLDLTSCGDHTVDLIIATKFPTYYAKHPKKSLWLVHQHRAAYDLYGSRYSDLSDDPRDEELRRCLVEGDKKVLSECSYLSTISKNVATRLKTYLNLDADVLYPPLPLGTRYRQGNYSDYILSVGRICTIKRVDLIIKALPIIHNFMKLKIVGAADEPGVMDYLKNEIAKHHLTDRVEFLGRVDDDTLINLYANALCVYYAPHNEDYGYVTLEAFASGKPVITAHDSGGVLEFVEDGVRGLICDPTTDSIGHTVNKLVENKELATQLGSNARRWIEDEMVTGWDHVISGLLSPLNQCVVSDRAA